MFIFEPNLCQNWFILLRVHETFFFCLFVRNVNINQGSATYAYVLNVPCFTPKFHLIYFLLSIYPIYFLSIFFSSRLSPSSLPQLPRRVKSELVTGVTARFCFNNVIKTLVCASGRILGPDRSKRVPRARRRPPGEGGSCRRSLRRAPSTGVSSFLHFPLTDMPQSEPVDLVLIHDLSHKRRIHSCLRSWSDVLL